MKCKLIDVLILIESGALEDNERVIVDDSLYYYNSKEQKLYTTPNTKCQDMYRCIDTWNMQIPCELIDHRSETTITQYVDEEISKINKMIDEL